MSLCVEDADLTARRARDSGKISPNGAQSAIRWTKYALNNWLRVDRPDCSMRRLALEISRLHRTPKLSEGLASHLEKRKPQFPQGCPI